MTDDTLRSLKEEIRRRDEEDRVKLQGQMTELMGFMNRMVMDVSIIKDQLNSYEGIPAAITRLEQRLEGYESVSQSMTKMNVVIDKVESVVEQHGVDLKDANVRIVRLETSQVKKDELESLKNEISQIKSRQDETSGATSARASLIAGIMSALGLVIAIVALLSGGK